MHPSRPTTCAARNLLDAENRWFYTMFLQSLGRYLDYKAELGQLDRMYAYARASLLHYARWMAEHEYPYLDKPEILEYPTETWAAQDMRKSEVFKYAALHAEGEERARFLERADFFFRYAVTKLCRDADADAVPAGGAAAVVRLHARLVPATPDAAAPAPAADRFRLAGGVRAAKGAGQEAFRPVSRGWCFPLGSGCIGRSALLAFPLKLSVFLPW